MPHEQTDARARVIYQDLLDLIAATLEEGQFEQYRNCISLPHKLETFDTQQVIATPDDLRQFFSVMRNTMKDAGNSRMIRNCTVVSFRDAQTIHGGHETRLVGHGAQLESSYYAYSVLKLEDGQWRVASSQYAEADQGFVDGILTKLRR